MVLTLIGYKEVSFTPAGSNDLIKGYNLFFTYEQKGVDGLACEKVFFSEAKADRCQFVPVLNCEYEVSYNKYGKPDYIEAV